MPSHPPPEEPTATKVICLGCGRTFSHFGHISHLKQTRNRPCRAIAEHAHEAQLAQAISSSETMFEETPAPDGDLFGTYDADEMPWPSLAGSSSPRFRHDTHLDTSADEDDVLMNGPDGPSTAGSQDTDDEDSDKSGEGESDDEEVLHETEGTSFTRVNESHIMIETFPSQYGDAGIAMEKGSGSLYKKYKLRGNDHQEDNMYAPFKSKLDWDFARWAKLRGPGSTATNELLNINGVSIICFNAAQLRLTQNC